MFSNQIRLIFLDSVITTFVLFYMFSVCCIVYGFFKNIISKILTKKRGCLSKYTTVSK